MLFRNRSAASEKARPERLLVPEPNEAGGDKKISPSPAKRIVQVPPIWFWATTASDGSSVTTYVPAIAPNGESPDATAADADGAAVGLGVAPIGGVEVVPNRSPIASTITAVAVMRVGQPTECRRRTRDSTAPRF